MAKGFALGIEHHGHVFGPVLFAQLAQHVDYAIDGAGWLPLAVVQWRQGMKSPEQVGRAINQDDGRVFFSHEYFRKIIVRTIIAKAHSTVRY